MLSKVPAKIEAIAVREILDVFIIKLYVAIVRRSLKNGAKYLLNRVVNQEIKMRKYGILNDIGFVDTLLPLVDTP
jgi:hypothetical protein